MSGKAGRSPRNVRRRPADGVTLVTAVSVPALRRSALPYGARFTRAPVAPQRMRWPPIVDAAHQLLHDALQGGTAKLLAQGIMYADGRTLDAYGETATGARLIAADKVNRAATLVFVTGGGFLAR